MRLPGQSLRVKRPPRVAWVALWLALTACGEDVLVGRVASEPVIGRDATVATCVVAACSGRILACGDCVDNDGDGDTDAADDHCSGPCDDTEDSFHPGLQGENVAQCRLDCFFDGDTGTGNDECFWSHACDELSVAPSFPPSADPRCVHDPATRIVGTSEACSDLAVAQSAICGATCLPLVPNGCDCFGCCELPAGAGRFVWLGSEVDRAGSCDAASVDDPGRCRPCTPVASCLNACDPCESCMGRPAPAAECADPGVAPPCSFGASACGSGKSPCPVGEYCVTGCCATLPK